MDDALRTAARAARAEVEHDLDIDAAWAEMLARIEHEPTAKPLPEPVERRRRWMLVAAAAAIAAVTVGLVVLMREPASIRTGPDTTPGVVTTSQPTVAATNPTEPTTAPPSTAPATSPATAPATAPASTPIDPDAIDVSYLDPPPAAGITPFGSYRYADPGRAETSLALGELGVLSVDDRGSLEVIAADGTVREVAWPKELTNGLGVVYGPRDVLYALVDTASKQGIELVAISLSGDKAGTVVTRSDPLGTERLPIALGHGPTGVVDLARHQGAVLLGYVDELGRPLDWSGAPASVPAIDQRGRVTFDSLAWQLAIRRDPAWSEDIEGPPPAPGPDGTAIYTTSIGSSVDAASGSSDGTLPVVAVLRPDGSGQWFSLTDGWRFESSSPWGVLVSRIDGENLTRELGLLDTTALVSPLRDPLKVDSGIASGCSDGSCASLAVDPDGVVVSFDPNTRTLSRHGTPPVTASVEVADNTWLAAAGPDGVAYLATQSAGVVDPIGDLVAVSLAGGDAGREITRWERALDLSGDTDLVATPTGIAEVGCCGTDRLRPDPAATVPYPWVARDGSTIAADVSSVRWDLDGIVTVGDRSWTFDLPDDQGLRGMPSIVATDEGGFVGAFPSIGGSEITTLTRGWSDGTTSTLRVDAFPVLVHPDGRVWFRDGGRLVIVDVFAGDARSTG